MSKQTHKSKCWFCSVQSKKKTKTKAGIAPIAPTRLAGRAAIVSVSGAERGAVSQVYEEEGGLYFTISSADPAASAAPEGEGAAPLIRHTRGETGWGGEVRPGRCQERSLEGRREM